MPEQTASILPATGSPTAETTASAPPLNKPENGQAYNAKIGKSREIPPFEQVLKTKITKESGDSETLEDLSQSNETQEQAISLYSSIDTTLVPQIADVIKEMKRLGLEKDMLFTPELELISYGIKTDLWGTTQRKDNPQIENEKYVEDPENPLNRISLNPEGNISIKLFGNQTVDTTKLGEILTNTYRAIKELRELPLLSGNSDLRSWVEHQAVSRGILQAKDQPDSPTFSLEDAGFVKAYTNGVDAMQLSSPVELWQTKEGRRIIVKRVSEQAEHTLPHEVLESEIMRMMGIPSPETTIQVLDGHPVLAVGFLEGYGEEANPFELTEKYHVNRMLQRGLLVDLWLNQYNRRPHNLMMKDGKIEFIDHGAAAFSRATGGFKGFSEEITTTNVWELLHTIPDDDPSGDVPVNKAYSQILEVQGGPRGEVVIHDPDFLRTETARLEKVTDDEIKEVVKKAGYPSGKSSIPIIESMRIRTQAETRRLQALLATPFEQWDPKLQQKGYLLPDGTLSPRFLKDLRWAEEAGKTFQAMIEAGGIQEYMTETLIKRKGNLVKFMHESLKAESSEIPIAKVEEVALSAGEIVRNFYKNGTTEAYKGERQVVTDADRQSEDLIKEKLLELHPASFYGEEGGGEALLEGDQWVVDPLDGTENMGGYPPAIGISIAMMRNGDPILGVIYDPIHDVMYSAKKGGGLRVNGVEARVSTVEDPTKARVGFDFSSDMATRAETLGYLDKVMTEKGARTGKLIGAPVLSMAAVASGRLELFFRPATKLPDLAAGVCLVREAGGRVVDFEGREWKIGAKGVIAGSPRMIEEFASSFQTSEIQTESLLERPEKPSTEEVINDPSLLRWETILPRIRAERAKGKTIVITNGHFALAHPGHSMSLEQARKAGVNNRNDGKNEGVVLLVIVNADHQTEAKDPIKAAAGTADERALTILDNRHSDIVMISDAPEGDSSLTTDFQRLAENGLIDANVVYVKGGDYGTEQSVPPEAQIIKQHGGTFVVVNRVGTFSTTNQVEKMLGKAKQLGKV